MDLKSSWEDHSRVTGVAGSAARASESRDLILASGVAYEFHTVNQGQTALFSS